MQKSTTGRTRVVIDPLRRNAACVNCRRRKIRCSGERPCCTTCIKTAEARGNPDGADCVYTTTPKGPPRGKAARAAKEAAKLAKQKELEEKRARERGELIQSNHLVMHPGMTSGPHHHEAGPSVMTTPHGRIPTHPAGWPPSSAASPYHHGPPLPFSFLFPQPMPTSTPPQTVWSGSQQVPHPQMMAWQVPAAPAPGTNPSGIESPTMLTHNTPVDSKRRVSDSDRSSGSGSPTEQYYQDRHPSSRHGKLNQIVDSPQPQQLSTTISTPQPLARSSSQQSRTHHHHSQGGSFSSSSPGSVDQRELWQHSLSLLSTPDPSGRTATTTAGSPHPDAASIHHSQAHLSHHGAPPSHLSSHSPHTPPSRSGSGNVNWQTFPPPPEWMGWPRMMGPNGAAPPPGSGSSFSAPPAPGYPWPNVCSG